MFAKMISDEVQLNPAAHFVLFRCDARGLIASDIPKNEAELMAILQLSFVPRWMSLTNCNFLSVCLIHVTGFCFGANLNFKGYPQAKMQVDLGRCKCLLWFLQYLRKKSALLQI